MNNSVYRGNELIGFRCFRCGSIYQSGWGTICNQCRNSDDENNKLRSEIARLSKALEESNKLTDNA